MVQILYVLLFSPALLSPLLLFSSPPFSSSPPLFSSTPIPSCSPLLSARLDQGWEDRLYPASSGTLGQGDPLCQDAYM